MSDRIYILAVIIQIISIIAIIAIVIATRIWSRIEEWRFERDMDEWVRDTWENAGQKTKKSKETEPAKKEFSLVSFYSRILKNVIKESKG